MSVCFCLKTCNLVVNILVMGLVLGSSLMVISIMGTSIKNHFYKMKRDIGMADYEKLVKQEFHTPFIEFIPHPYIFVSL